MAAKSSVAGLGPTALGILTAVVLAVGGYVVFQATRTPDAPETQTEVAAAPSDTVEEADAPEAPEVPEETETAAVDPEAPVEPEVAVEPQAPVEPEEPAEDVTEGAAE